MRYHKNPYLWYLTKWFDFLEGKDVYFIERVHEAVFQVDFLDIYHFYFDPITSILYMVINLKVVVIRSFNCECRACYVGNPCKSLFFEFAKVTFFLVKVSRKLDIMIAEHRLRERWSSRKFRESNIFIREEWPFPEKGILINNQI